MSDWRNNPRMGKSTFMPLLNDINERMKRGETVKMIYDSYIESDAIGISYAQFTRYVKKYCLDGQLHTPSKEKTLNDDSGRRGDLNPDNKSNDSDTVEKYMQVCFRNKRLADRAIESGVSIETIESWKSPNQQRLSNTLTNYLLKN